MASGQGCTDDGGSGYEYEESALGALQSDSDGELSDVDEDA